MGVGNNNLHTGQLFFVFFAEAYHCSDFLLLFAQVPNAIHLFLLM